MTHYEFNLDKFKRGEYPFVESTIVHSFSSGEALDQRKARERADRLAASGYTAESAWIAVLNGQLPFESYCKIMGGTE